MKIKLPLLLTGLSLLNFAAPSISFGAYSKPPSWNPMVMLPVSYSYHTATGHYGLAIEAEADEAPYSGGLAYPTLNAAPGTYNSTTKLYDSSVVSFDPSKVWSVLNGTAYSRVLGWWDETSDDFYATYADALPANTFVWIEKITGSPELKTFTVSEEDNPNGPYTPIFGTAGSNTKWLWDGFMDHNVNAVSLTDITSANQTFYATYHLYLGDSQGNQLAGYDDTTTTWTWLWNGAAPSFVPEPSSLGLLLLGAVVTVTRKR